MVFLIGAQSVVTTSLLLKFHVEAGHFLMLYPCSSRCAANTLVVTTPVQHDSNKQLTTVVAVGEVGKLIIT